MASRSCRKTCPPVSTAVKIFLISMLAYPCILHFCVLGFFFCHLFWAILKKGTRFQNTIGKHAGYKCIYSERHLSFRIIMESLQNKPGNAADKQTNIREVVSGMPLKSEKATRKPAPLNLLAKRKAKVSVLQVYVFNSVCARMCFSVHEVQSAVPGFLIPH